MTIVSGEKTDPPQPRSKGFRPQHPWDRNLFLALVVLVWIGLVMGFGGAMLPRLKAGELNYPPLLHLHAVLFWGWVVLLSTQLYLVRRGRPDLHRKLGLLGAGLAGLMIVVGVATAFAAQTRPGSSQATDPAFLIVPLTDMVGFAGLAAAGLLLRRQSSAHKRLMLLATILISDAGFARWHGGYIASRLPDSFAGQYLAGYLGPVVLILVMGAYDIVTRRRLLPAYVLGATWAIAIQLTATAIYLSPAWEPVARRWIQAWS